ncbi:hypothetical protein ACOMHN_036277 [Nucella lapillus]
MGHQGEEDRRQGPLGEEDTGGDRQCGEEAPGAIRGGGPPWEKDCRQGEEDRHGRRTAAMGHQGEEDRRQGPLGEEDVYGRMIAHGEEDNHGRRIAARGHYGRRTSTVGLPPGSLGENDLHGRRTAARGHHGDEYRCQDPLCEKDCRQGSPGEGGSPSGGG